MSQEVRNLEPQALWNNFADLNEVPRPSKKEERVIEFAKSFGEGLGLETFVDEVGNVIIRKPASPGMEDRLPIVMQSHLDMVHQKNADTDFDFDTQGIQMFIDGDWVKAKGTTLGADNGLGVASIMTILASDEIAHPPLEALFTIDEETGMTGAKGLKGGLLNGAIMLNLDTEDDDELTIGCAGGVDVTASRTYTAEATPAGMVGYKVIVRGLKGGHSGMEIHLGYGNANKLMNRLLWNSAQSCGTRVSEIDGGGLRNAIPRESFSIVAVPESNASAFEAFMDQEGKVIQSEYKLTDPNAEITFEKMDAPGTVLDASLQATLLGSIYACPNGIFRMSPEIQGLVQTSNNLARVEVKDGNITIGCLTRSAVNSERDDLAHSIQANFENTGATCSLSGDYTGWAPRSDSAILKVMDGLYQELFNEKPNVLVCHAGLECGILGENYPEMEMISFGPNIKGAHSPDERTQISSVQKYWGFLMEALKRIPSAN